MEEQQINDEITPKKGRHRKKLLYSSLKDLMEFYFSDVNLSKDRFLAQLIQKDPYIDLSIFLKFNKVRHLTNEISDLCKAISKSEILMLSEDNIKVCRTTPIRVKENEDECTIYVEHLPDGAEHDWLKNAFSKFGQVDYVSIPRYKENKLTKGFAFIEFDTPETAKKALEYFESIDCKLPTSMLPNQLASILSFKSEKSNKKQNQFTTKIKTTEDMKESTENIPQNETSDSETKVKRKKRKETDDQAETNEVKMKKLDQELEIELNESEEPLTKKVKKKKKDKQKQDFENEQINETVEVEEGKKKKKDKNKQDVENEESNETVEVKEGKKKKKKKEKERKENEQITEHVEVEEIESNEIKKKKKKHEKINMELENNDKAEEAEDVSEKKKRKKSKSNSSGLQQYGLKVLSKKEWKQLRNKYLNLERAQNLKQHLHRSHFANIHNNLENIADKNSSENLKDKSDPRFKFTPGAIVHITLPDTFNDYKKMKSDIRSQPGFQYIDVKIGSNVGYIRFSDNSSAKKFCETGYINSDLAILKGNDEKEYWEIISQNREEQFKKELNKKQWGRDKLAKKAEKKLGKHIKFENAE